MILDNEITSLKGIGEKTAELYHKVGIYTYGDLIFYYPRDYIKYDEPISPEKAGNDEICFVKAVITKRPLLRRAGRMSVVSAPAATGGAVINAVWFHMPYLVKSLRAGQEYILGGRIRKKGNSFLMEQPLIFVPGEYDRLKNTLQPIYPLTKGLSNNAVRKAVASALNMLPEKDVSNDIPSKSSLKAMHFPQNYDEMLKARSELVFDEFLMFILRLRMLKGDNSRALNDFEIRPSDKVRHMTKELPYELTGAQKSVFDRVEEDLAQKSSMSRLIQGDVGCGKTIIALLACLTVTESGYQCALMAPTEILARQHFDYFSEMISAYEFDTKVVLLTGSMKAAERRNALEMIKSGEAGIVIGTHALFQEKVEYERLALVITDEQHRFGVRQREFLAGKGVVGFPHVLVMSATPIPRTLAIILYGDLDISVIDELPARRLPIKNCVVSTDYRKKAYEFIKKEVAASHQAYVICPMVEESEGLDCEDVVSYSEKLKTVLGEGIRVEYLHGKMKGEKKDRIMKDFLEGKTDVLVSTTVVEVGVNVPNATVMMIENSERFGLAQLHQLRGRIGRGDAQSYCIFINCSDSDKSRQRLETLNKSNDGFFIAQEDLRLRGPGDLFGIRQSGEMQFRLADIYNDSELLYKAAERADEILNDDPLLEKKENEQIKKRLDMLSDASGNNSL